MFSGQIVDSRELGSLEKELAHLRAQRSDVEERLLDVMQTVETLQSELVAAGTKVEETRSRWDTDRPETEVRITRLTDELEDLRAERESLAAELDPRSIDMYQRLRKASGHAVSAVSGGICQWCRVAIPSKDLQHARAGALVACNNCARILYIAG
jgi:predicted  nucleic acid-binding Zn-ribbon protein